MSPEGLLYLNLCIALLTVGEEERLILGMTLNEKSDFGA